MRKKAETEKTELEKQLEFYGRFLPVELFGELGVTDTAPLALHTQRELKAAILYLNVAGFQEIVRLKEASEIYTLINEIVSACIPVVYDQGGIIEEFVDAGFRALFYTKPGEALQAAVRLCEIIQRKENGFGYWESFSMGFTYGSVITGIVGHERRMSSLTLSVYTGLARHLQDMGYRFGAKILVTGALADLVPGFAERYNQRMLGYLYVKNGGFVEKLYDVFDGDTARVRNQKRKTRSVFEKGVRLFSEENYARARFFFIEVLKTDRADKAAKQYVQLCEKYMISKDKEGIFLEIY